MQIVYAVPQWFLQYDLFFHIVFAAVTMLVSGYAFKVYRLTGMRQSKLFGLGFLFIAIAFVFQFIMNFMVLSELTDPVVTIVDLQSAMTFHALGLISHMVFYLLGLIILTYVSLKLECSKTFVLFVVITLSALVLSKHALLTFFVLSTILLIYIVIHYIRNSVEHRGDLKSWLVLIAFFFLLIGHIGDIVAVNYLPVYVFAHLIELIAYVLILINLILVVKK